MFEQPCVTNLPRNGSPRTTRHTRIYLYSQDLFKRRQQRPANKSSRSNSKSEKLIPTEPTRWHRTPCLTGAGTAKAYQSLRGKYEHYVYSVSLTISWPPPYSCVIVDILVKFYTYMCDYTCNRRSRDTGTKTPYTKYLKDIT